MSAIWGIIDFSNRESSFLASHLMKKAYETSVLDRISERQDKCCFMACGLQCFMPYAPYENLPFMSDDMPFWLTADVVLDNHAELVQEFQSYYPLISDDTPDGALLYLAFDRWHVDCIYHLRGVFSFVIFSLSEHKVYAFTDHVGERCLYYHQKDGVFQFSTRIDALRQILPDLPLSKYYLGHQLIYPDLRVSQIPSLSLIESIFKIEPGTYVSFDGMHLESHRYWHPKMSSVSLPTNSQLIGKYVYDTLTCAVQDCIHHQDLVASQLSSGLDSSTISAIAASLLAKTNKTLHTITNLPSKEFLESYRPTYETRNFDVSERGGALEVASMYTNIKASFLRSNPTFSLDDLSKLVRQIEIPFKSFANIGAIYEDYSFAAHQGCRILLRGEYGNMTISAGKLKDALYDALITRDIKTLNKIIKDLKKYHNISFLRLMHILLPNYLSSLYSRSKYQLHHAHDPVLEGSFLEPTLAKELHLVDDIREKGYNLFPRDFLSHKDYQNQVYLVPALSHMGEIATKLSLATGVLSRDPTKDPRLLSLCYNLPMNAFFNKGTERWLVRGSMQGNLPSSILKNMTRRGLQSSDIFFRLESSWSDILPMLHRSCFSSFVSNYLNQDALSRFFTQASSFSDINNRLQLYSIFYVFQLSIL